MATAAAQTRINEEIAKETVKYISSICNLRTQRNNLAPISRLPVETLVTIFVHCARDFHYQAHRYSTLTVRSWVNVSHVCRHWRNVALDSPTLWTYIFMTSRRWTEISLARSKQMPLKLRVSASAHQTSHVLRLVEQVMNHVERIQELRLDLPAKVAPRVFSKLSSRAPGLQNLSICTRGGTSPEWSSALFGGDTPALHTLELSSCPLPWHSFTLSGLTTLSLTDVPADFRQNMVEFLSTLRCMQGVRHLYLNNALHCAASLLSVTVVSNPLQKVDLPYLSRLLVVTPISTLVQFLSCITIPSTTEVRLYCESDEDLPTDHYPLLFFALGQTFSVQDNRALSNHKIRSLVIEAPKWEEVQLTFSGSECDREFVKPALYPEWECGIPLKITVDLPWVGENIMYNIFSAMPLTDIQSVRFIDVPLLSAAGFWWRMLAHRCLQGLHCIELSMDRDDEKTTDPMSLLSVATKGDQYNRHIKLMPMLEEIELHQMEFPPEGEASLQSLFDALASRNNPQGRLTMVDCYISGFDLDPFDMVRLWDGTIVSGGYPSFMDGDSKKGECHRRAGWPSNNVVS